MTTGQVNDDADRAVGALLGLACGDAVGTTLEFEPPGTFAPIDDLVGGGPFGLRPGEWTDDTSMALCLAESLLDRGGHDPDDQMRRYLLWRDEGYLSSTGTCFDIGNTVSGQLSRYRSTGEPVDPTPNQQSAANGSLMRLGARADPLARRRRGRRRPWPPSPADPPMPPSDRSTPAGSWARWWRALIQGADADEVFAPSFWRWGALHPAVAAVASGSWRDKDAGEIRGSGYCVAALEAAVWAVAGAADFRDAVLRAANLGDDADTTAAIAGQLAGARWGAAGIPPAWLERIVLRDRIVALAARLFDAGTVAQAESAAPRPSNPPSPRRRTPSDGRTTTGCTPGGSRPGGCWRASTPGMPTRWPPPRT